MRKNATYRWLSLIFIILTSLHAHADPVIEKCKDYSQPLFTKADFHAPYPDKVTALISKLPENEREKATLACAKSLPFKESMRRLEYAVAQAAIDSKSVNQEMTNLVHNTYHAIKEIIEIQAELAAEDGVRAFNKNRALAHMLTDHFGKCLPGTTGCVGKDPGQIRDAFKNGNPRENLYLMSTTNDYFLYEVVLCNDEHCLCSNESALAKLKIKAKTDVVMAGLLASCFEHPHSALGPLSTGRFRKANDYFRKPLEGKTLPRNTQVDADLRRDQLMDLQTFNVNNLMVPLSDREREFLTHSGSLDAENPHPLVRFDTGESRYIPVHKSDLNFKNTRFPDPDNLYYGTAEKFGFPIKTSISGTTEALLSVGCVMNTSNQKSRERLRLAAIAAMIPERHHSIYEIMISSKSFPNIDINPNTDYYKFLMKDEPDFAQSVEKNYHKLSSLSQTKDLPTDIYADCIESNLPTSISPTSRWAQVRPIESPCSTQLNNSQSLEVELFLNRSTLTLGDVVAPYLQGN